MFHANSRLRIATCLAALATVAACSDPTVTQDARTSLVPPPPLLDITPGVAAVLDVPYASRSASQKLDVYVPTTGAKPYPVVLWVHGGGWMSGDKKMPATAFQLKLLGSGIAVVSVNYRLSGEAKFPAQIQDVKAALRWVRANAARYNLDAARIGAWGLSAGGHLVALLGTSSGVPALTDPSLGNPTMSEAVKTVVDWSGPVNLLQMDSQLAADGCPLFGGSGYGSAGSPASQLMGKPIYQIPSQVHATSPRSYVGAGDPKFLIQHGKKDCTVPWQQSQALHTRLQASLGGAASQLDLFPNGKHGGSDFTSPTNVARVISFIRATL